MATTHSVYELEGAGADWIVEDLTRISIMQVTDGCIQIGHFQIIDPGSSIDLHAINVYAYGLFEMWCTQYTTDWVLSLDILLLEKCLKCKG